MYLNLLYIYVVHSYFVIFIYWLFYLTFWLYVNKPLT